MLADSVCMLSQTLSLAIPGAKLSMWADDFAIPNQIITIDKGATSIVPYLH